MVKINWKKFRRNFFKVCNTYINTIFFVSLIGQVIVFANLGAFGFVSNQLILLFLITDMFLIAVIGHAIIEGVMRDEKEVSPHKYIKNEEKRMVRK